jgi:hypothetical protein
MSGDDLRGSVKEAFATLWTIDGVSGIYRHVGGCKRDFVPADDETIVAETNGTPAMFRLDEPVMKAVKLALGIVTK